MLVDRLVLADRTGALSIMAGDAVADDVLSVHELVSHIVLASGVTPEVRRRGRSPAIWLGSMATHRFGDLVPPEHPQGFVVRVTAEDVAICGGSSLGTLYGVYELLERCGVRWAMPGPAGTIVPRGSLTAPLGEIRSQPRHRHRGLQSIQTPQAGGWSPMLEPQWVDPPDPTADWYRRQRLDHVRFGGHRLPLWPPASPETEPDLYIHEHGRPTAQWDVTRPAVLSRVEAGIRRVLAADPSATMINLGPAEGQGFGQTAWDLPGRRDPLSGELVVTDRYVRFFNQLLARLSPDHPDLRLAFYAHGALMEPPARERPNPRLVPVIAPIGIDLHTSIADGVGGERRYLMRVIDEWRALGLDWMYRGYLGTVGDPGLPFSAAAQLAAELPEIAARGAGDAIRLECFGGWGHQGMAFYLAAKLMWDPTRDASAVLQDYRQAAFGPAASAVGSYFDQLHATSAASPFSTAGFGDAAATLTLPIMAGLERSLLLAEQRVSGDRHSAHRQRLRQVRLAHDHGSRVLDCHQYHLRGAYIEAASALRLARAEGRAALANTPSAIWRLAPNRVEEHLGAAVDQISQLVSRFGPPMAITPRMWEALIDDSGATARPGLPDGLWTRLDAWQTWSTQGMRYATGAAWYRCELPGRQVPGRPQLALPVAGAACRSWLNGYPLRELASAADGVVRLDLGPAWSVNGPNQLLVQLLRTPGGIGAVGLLGTGMVFADPAVPWQPSGRTPSPARPLVEEPGSVPPPILGLDRESARGEWWVLLDPYGMASRLQLHDDRHDVEGYRAFDPTLTLADQGLGRYQGGLVIRTVLTVPRRAMALQLCAPEGTPQVWLDGVEIEAQVSASGWCSVAVPSGARPVRLAIAVPPGPVPAHDPLSPYWMLQPELGPED